MTTKLNTIAWGKKLVIFKVNLLSKLLLIMFIKQHIFKRNILIHTLSEWTIYTCIIIPFFVNCNKNILVIKHNCRNPSLEFTTKARVCKVASQEGSRESHNILLGV